ncbi:hypothetical protein [Embleya sp. NPDC001921]
MSTIDATSAIDIPAPSPRPPTPAKAAATTRPTGRHRRARRRKGRLHRRLLAYREVDLVHSADPARDGGACLLLVHRRRIVGCVTYRVCPLCALGVITEVRVREPFRDTGLGTRALSHLQATHPGTTWHNTDPARLIADLMRRMRIPSTPTPPSCPHPLATPPGPPRTATP